MDAALQELGSGIESADCTLWRAPHPVSVNTKAGTACYKPKTVPVLFYDISSIARNPQSYSRDYVWTEPTKISLTTNV